MKRPGAPALVAIAAAALPLISVHVAWLLSLHYQLIPACNPYWDGCTSISGACRQEPVIFWFRFTMQPYGWLLIAFWAFAATWCAHIHPTARIRRWALLGCGAVGAAFYTLYATYLGESGEIPSLLRRYGINLYFSMTVLAQMLLISVAASAQVLGTRMRQGFVTILALLLLLGLASLPLQFMDITEAEQDAWLNVLEWWYALLMVALYPLTALAFERTGFRLQSVWQTR